MSRGPRGDLKVLRSFRPRPADPGQGVPQEVIDNGNAILAKMNKIKSFVKDQRQRQTKGNSKAQWFSARDRLKEEMIAAERDLLHHMADMAEQGGSLGSEISECIDTYEMLRYKGNMSTMQVKEEVAELQQLADSVANHGWRSSPEDISMARDGLYFSRSEFEQQVLSLREELSVLQEDLRSHWPSAMGGGLGNDPLQGFGHIGELQQLIRKYPEASQDVKDKAIELCQSLEARFTETMEAWRLEFTSGEQGLHRATGSWPAEEHTSFVRERAEAVVAVGGEGGREAYVRRLAVLFPNRTIKELMDHDQWYISRKLMLDRRKTIRESWLRERRKLLEQVKATLQRSAKLEAMQARTAAEMLEWEAAQQQLRSELAVMQHQREVEAEAAAAEKAVADQKAALEAARREEQRRHEMEQKKMLISQYREENRHRQEQEDEIRRVQEAEDARLRAAQAIVNQERVDYRSVLYDMKVEDREAKALELQLEEEERERRLEKLRSKVVVEAERDPDRVLQPTAASCAEDLSSQGIFHNGNGFSDDHLFRDQRFKLTMALAEKGLLQNKHAQAYTSKVISSAKSLVPARLDNLTSLQREKRMYNL